MRKYAENFICRWGLLSFQAVLFIISSYKRFTEPILKSLSSRSPGLFLFFWFVFFFFIFWSCSIQQKFLYTHKSNFSCKSRQMFLELSFLAFSFTDILCFSYQTFVFSTSKRTNQWGPTTPSSDLRWHYCDSDLPSLLPALVIPQTTSFVIALSHGLTVLTSNR